MNKYGMSKKDTDTFIKFIFWGFVIFGKIIKSMIEGFLIITKGIYILCKKIKLFFQNKKLKEIFLYYKLEYQNKRERIIKKLENINDEKQKFVLMEQLKKINFNALKFNEKFDILTADVNTILETKIDNLVNYYNNLEKDLIYDKKECLIDQIDNMTGQQFENILIKILLMNGYSNVEGTNYTGDYGVDIIAFKNNIKCAIQCKRFSQKVSVKAIQEIVSGRAYYKCDKAIVVTNNYYTKNAKQLAFSNRVDLWDRDDVLVLINNYNKNEQKAYDIISEN